MNKVYFNNYFMTHFLFNSMEDKTDFVFINVAHHIKHKKIPFIFKLIKVRVIPFIYLLILYTYKLSKLINKPYEGTVLYFSVENMYELSLLLFKNRKMKRHVLWLWNPASSFGKNKFDNWVYLHIFIPTLKLIGVELWSFDKADVNKYRFKYHPQIHNSSLLIQSANLNVKKALHSEKVFLFVGLDKGRLHKLSSLKSILASFNVNCEFHITADPGKEYALEDKPLVSEGYLPYTDYLHKISNTFGLIDFVQNGQNGLTLRVLESLFLKKKLITNNVSVKNYDFYNPTNILILNDKIDPTELTLFLTSDFVDVNVDVLEKHDLHHLLKSVFK